jgi:hypothetical protein
MKNISSYPELLQNHALTGDPAAFYSLFGKQILQLYIMLRNNGVSHEKADNDVTSFLTSIYVKYVKSRPLSDPGEWLVRNLKFLKGYSKETLPDNVSENVAADQIKDFERKAMIAIQREYSRLKEAHSVTYLRGPRTTRKFKRNMIFISALVFVFLGLFFGFDYLLRSTDSSIDISMTLPRYIISFSLPSGYNKGSTNAQPNQNTGDTSNTADSVNNTTDTISKQASTAQIPDLPEKKAFNQYESRLRKKPVTKKSASATVGKIPDSSAVSDIPGTYNKEHLPNTRADNILTNNRDSLIHNR